MEFKLRQNYEPDNDFIYNSWLKSYRKSEPEMSNLIYYESFKKNIESILKRSNVVIACNEINNNDIIGYVVFESLDPVVIHYIYVKFMNRQLGVGGTLVKIAKGIQDVAVCTFATKSFFKLNKKWGLSYNPWMR
mgnify:CR=1 FL=1